MQRLLTLPWVTKLKFASKRSELCVIDIWMLLAIIKKILFFYTKQWTNHVRWWPPFIDFQKYCSLFIINNQDSCVICYMLDYGELPCLYLLIKVNKKQFNAIEIKNLVAWYKPQVTCTQQHSTYMFQ